MHFSGEPDLQGQRLKYLSVKRGKGKSENFHFSLYHVLLKDILIVDPEDPVHRRNALVIIEKKKKNLLI